MLLSDRRIVPRPHVLRFKSNFSKEYQRPNQPRCTQMPCSDRSKIHAIGGVAQLGERVVRNDEVGSSILLLSTKTHKKASITAGFFHERRFFNCRIWHPWLGASSCRVGRTPCQRLGQHDRGGRPPRQPPWGRGCFGH